MADIPDWAKERACELANAEAPLRWNPKRQHPAIDAMARLIAAHEEPPIDPLLIEARKIAASRLKDGVRYLSFHAGDADLCAMRYREGKNDDEFVLSLVAAIKRGMELERGK